MVWGHIITSHYLNQCWLRSMLPNGITRPQSVNLSAWVYQAASHYWDQCLACMMPKWVNSSGICCQFVHLYFLCTLVRKWILGMLVNTYIYLKIFNEIVWIDAVHMMTDEKFILNLLFIYLRLFIDICAQFVINIYFVNVNMCLFLSIGESSYYIWIWLWYGKHAKVISFSPQVLFTGWLLCE